MAFRSPRADAILAVLLTLALTAGVLLWLYYPVVPRSVLGWILLIIIGIPTWFLLEWLGNRALGMRVFSRLGRAARIALAIPVLILVVVVAAYLIYWGQRAISGV